MRTLPLRILRERYRNLKRWLRRQRNRRRTTEAIFTDIYKHNRWGGQRGEYCSGSGSAAEAIVSAYVTAIAATAAHEGFLGTAFVDLGCGDFSVGRRLAPLCASYIGVDVVAPLIRQHQAAFGNERTRFMHLDMIVQPLPHGDVCFARQVLQHLSNQQISAVLTKLQQYRWVLITEHYPSDNSAIVPNVDKICGDDIRARSNSGVYLTQPPFSLSPQAVQQVLEVPGVGLGDNADPGVIRTFLYKPQGPQHGQRP